MLTSQLWAAVRQRGCQFLGPHMQESTLQLIHFLLRDGEQLQRKSIVLFVVSRLEKFPTASKTNVGHVVQLLYRASCFHVTKRKDASSLLQLKEDFRSYENLRREHDAQIVQIAYEAGLRISPEQWSSLIYGDPHHKSHMQSIIDKLQTAQSFYNSLHELMTTLKKYGDPMDVMSLKSSFELLASINTNSIPGEKFKMNYKCLVNCLDSVCIILDKFIQFSKSAAKMRSNFQHSPLIEHSTNRILCGSSTTTINTNNIFNNMNSALLPNNNALNTVPNWDNNLHTNNYNNNSNYNNNNNSNNNSNNSNNNNNINNSNNNNNNNNNNNSNSNNSNSNMDIIQGRVSVNKLNSDLFDIRNYASNTTSNARAKTNIDSNNTNSANINERLLSYDMSIKTDKIIDNANHYGLSTHIQGAPPKLRFLQSPNNSDIFHIDNLPYWDNQHINNNSTEDILAHPRSLPDSREHNINNSFINNNKNNSYFKEPLSFEDSSNANYRSLPINNTMHKNTATPRFNNAYRYNNCRNTTDIRSPTFYDMKTLMHYSPSNPRLSSPLPSTHAAPANRCYPSNTSLYSSGYSSIAGSPSATTTDNNSTLEINLGYDRGIEQYNICKQSNNSNNNLWHDYDEHYMKLAKKEKELQEREAIIKQKERDYIMTSSTQPLFTYDRNLEEFLDKEVAAELQKDEIPNRNRIQFPSYVIENDSCSIDPVLNKIIRDLHIDN